MNKNHKNQQKKFNKFNREIIKLYKIVNLYSYFKLKENCLLIKILKALTVKFQ